MRYTADSTDCESGAIKETVFPTILVKLKFGPGVPDNCRIAAIETDPLSRLVVTVNVTVDLASTLVGPIMLSIFGGAAGGSNVMVTVATFETALPSVATKVKLIVPM